MRMETPAQSSSPNGYDWHEAGKVGPAVGKVAVVQLSKCVCVKRRQVNMATPPGTGLCRVSRPLK